ncbi:MAG: RpoL/Rpb11 RNA polymerase subunit family protein [Candidatus ainarchaeum sp.]|nr:RpoL/Rpb11 RNA polymerase subunit family protein [Candidatus ainarchaeum sp.]MDD3976350.1 RpoL/Rpb11 RNA polymerase subunit family protein [Candidatus ainarchaeum sp.]
MEIEINNISKEEIELTIKEEDIAIYKLIEEIANNQKEVEFVAIKKADHLKPEFNFYMKVKTGNAKDLLLNYIEEAEKNLENILDQLEKAISKKE